MCHYILSINLYAAKDNYYFLGAFAKVQKAIMSCVMSVRPSGYNGYYLLTYLLTSLLTPWGRVLLEKLVGSLPAKIFPAFCETRRCITAFASARHLSLTRVRSVKSKPLYPHFLKIRLNIILPYSLGFPSGPRFPHPKQFLPIGL